MYTHIDNDNDDNDDDDNDNSNSHGAGDVAQVPNPPTPSPSALAGANLATSSPPRTAAHSSLRSNGTIIRSNSFATSSPPRRLVPLLCIYPYYYVYTPGD